MATNGNGRSDPERQKFETDLIGLMPFLRAFALSLTGKREVAEDLAQETLLKAWKSQEMFAPGTNLKAWLFTILRNELYSQRRRAWRWQEWDPELAERTLTTETQISETEAADNFRRMLTCLACLSSEQSDSLVAVGYLGMSYDEAAKHLGCAVGTVKSRVARARRELSRLINGATIGRIDLARLRSSAYGLRPSDPLYPIAKAYEDLYAALELPINTSDLTPDLDPAPHNGEEVSLEESWRRLVVSGALDEGQESLQELFDADPSEF